MVCVGVLSGKSIAELLVQVLPFGFASAYPASPHLPLSYHRISSVPNTGVSVAMFHSFARPLNLGFPKAIVPSHVLPFAGTRLRLGIFRPRARAPPPRPCRVR